MQRVRKGDEVVVIAGKDKGKRGRVLRVVEDASRVVVEGVNVVTKHRKPTRQNQRGGVDQIEAPLHISNVMLWDAQAGKPTRVGVRVLADGKRVRFGKKSGEQIDK